MKRTISVIALVAITAILHAQTLPSTIERLQDCFIKVNEKYIPDSCFFYQVSHYYGNYSTFHYDTYKNEITIDKRYFTSKPDYSQVLSVLDSIEHHATSSYRNVERYANFDNIKYVLNIDVDESGLLRNKDRDNLSAALTKNGEGYSFEANSSQDSRFYKSQLTYLQMCPCPSDVSGHIDADAFDAYFGKILKDNRIDKMNTTTVIHDNGYEFNFDSLELISLNSADSDGKATFQTYRFKSRDAYFKACSEIVPKLEDFVAANSKRSECGIMVTRQGHQQIASCQFDFQTADGQWVCVQMRDDPSLSRIENGALIRGFVLIYGKGTGPQWILQGMSDMKSFNNGVIRYNDGRVTRTNKEE